VEPERVRREPAERNEFHRCALQQLPMLKAENFAQVFAGVSNATHWVGGPFLILWLAYWENSQISKASKLAYPNKTVRDN
jgi:hypothetical protein